MSFSRDFNYLATNEERERAKRLRAPNIPMQYPAIREWAPGANVGTLISVIQTGAGVSGPSRTMLPQAQPPLAEQPQRTKEEPYFSSFLGQMVRSLRDTVPLSERERLTFSRPATPSQAWRPGYIVDEDLVTIDEESIEMSRRRKQTGTVVPPIATQPVRPLLDLIRKRSRGVK